MGLGVTIVNAQRGLLAAVFTGLAVLAMPLLAQATENTEAAFPAVPWCDLMVNLPEADMDAYALEIVQQTGQGEHLKAAAPTPLVMATIDSPAVSGEPSQLDIDEVILSRADWLWEINQQANIALASNNWPLAELRLAQALGEFTDAHDTRLRLAALLYGRGALEQTRIVLQEGIALAPDYPEFRLALSRLLAEQQRYEAAFEQLNQVNPAMAANLDYYSLKAEVARRSGRCAQAISTYQQLLALGGVGAWWLGLGLCQRDLGEDFIPAFKQARASADLGAASQRFVEQQLKQQALRD